MVLRHFLHHVVAGPHHLAHLLLHVHHAALAPHAFLPYRHHSTRLILPPRLSLRLNDHPPALLVSSLLVGHLAFLWRLRFMVLRHFLHHVVAGLHHLAHLLHHVHHAALAHHAVLAVLHHAARLILHRRFSIGVNGRPTGQGGDNRGRAQQCLQISAHEFTSFRLQLHDYRSVRSV